MGWEAASKRTLHERDHRGRDFYGIELVARNKRREGLLAAAEAMFAENFAGRIFSFDNARVFPSSTNAVCYNLVK